MKNKLKYLIFILILLISQTSIVLAEDFNFCEYRGVVQSMKIFGILILICKIIIPIIIIYNGVYGFGKAAINSAPADEIKKTATQLIKSVVAGFVIFVIPSFIDFVFTYVVDAHNSEYAACYNCIMTPTKSSCVVPETDPIDEDDSNAKTA